MIDGHTTSCVSVWFVREQRGEIGKCGKCETHVEREGQGRLVRDAPNGGECARRASAFLLGDGGCLGFYIGSLRGCRAREREEIEAKAGELTKEMRATCVGNATPKDPA